MQQDKAKLCKTSIIIYSYGNNGPADLKPVCFPFCYSKQYIKRRYEGMNGTNEYVKKHTRNRIWCDKKIKEEEIGAAEVEKQTEKCVSPNLPQIRQWKNPDNTLAIKWDTSNIFKIH